MPVITTDDLEQSWAQQLPQTLKQKVRESEQDYKITLSDVRPNYLAHIINGVVDLQEKVTSIYFP